MTFLGSSLIGRRTAVVAGIIVSAASTVACSDSATAPYVARLPQGISAVDNPDLGKIAAVSPVVDGTITPGEYDGAATFSFRVVLPPSALGTGASMAYVYVTHDQTHLYIATIFDRKSPFHNNDHIAFEFDKDNDGVQEDGDDILLTGPSGAMNVAHPGADFYRYNGGGFNQGDNGGGGTIDVISAWGAVGTKGVFEIRQDLDNTDDAHDISIDPSNGAVTVGMRALIGLEANPIGSNVIVRSWKPSPTTYCKLTIGKKTTSVSCP